MDSSTGRPMMTVLRTEGDAPSPSTPDEPEERRPRPWETPGLGRRILVGVVVVWAVAITAVVLFRGDGKTPAPVATGQPTASPSASQGPLTATQIFQQLQPSVVLIQATGAKAGTEATGTGFIENANGTVLTARHVIAGATAISLTFADGTKTTATVASQDATTDIATLTPAKLPETVVPATLGGAVKVGDAVVAIGNPLGLTQTTTSGVVSGLNRSLATENGTQSGLIQFDAAVNPGSSGGPLINDRGQVVGVVVALANPTKADTFIGIGFAVPIGAALGAGQGDGHTPPL